MDTQLKKGLLEICVLAAVYKDDSYGYKIVSDVSPQVEISESTLYPILRRLEQNAFLTTYETAYNGRLRKYYSITEQGKAKVAEFLDGWCEIEKVYGFIKGEAL